MGDKYRQHYRQSAGTEEIIGTNCITKMAAYIMPLPRATNSNLFFHSSTNYHTTTTTSFSTTTDYCSPFLLFPYYTFTEHRALLLLLTASACSAVIITLFSSTPLQQQPLLLLLLPLPLLKHSLCPLSRLTGLVVAMEGNKDKDNTDNAPLVRRMHQSPVMYPVCHVTNFI